MITSVVASLRCREGVCPRCQGMSMNMASYWPSVVSLLWEHRRPWHNIGTTLPGHDNELSQGFDDVCKAWTQTLSMSIFLWFFVLTFFQWCNNVIDVGTALTKRWVELSSLFGRPWIRCVSGAHTWQVAIRCHSWQIHPPPPPPWGPSTSYTPGCICPEYYHSHSHRSG